MDVDSFGSEGGRTTGAALGAVAHGGLLYLTSTDGVSTAGACAIHTLACRFARGAAWHADTRRIRCRRRPPGKRPLRSLAAYGAWLRPLPHANEQGLRALVGAAVREGAARGLALTPLFSYYSYHGPVHRVL